MLILASFLIEMDSTHTQQRIRFESGNAVKYVIEDYNTKLRSHYCKKCDVRLFL